jgi:hypothetical protein
MDDRDGVAEHFKAQRLAAAAQAEKRATWIDRWRAWRNPGHWLNDARRVLLMAEHGLVYSCRHGTWPTPCRRCFGENYDLEAPRSALRGRG